MKTSLLLLAILWLLPGSGYAQEKEGTYLEFLQKTSLSAADCKQRKPVDLMEIIAEKHHFICDGDRKQREELDSLFCQKYVDALRPGTDAAFPEAKTVRPALRKLLYTICDFTDAIAAHHHPDTTHACIDAYVEYLLADFRTDDADLPYPDYPTHKDVVAFARMKAALSAHHGRAAPDYDLYAAKISSELTVVEKADPKRRLYDIYFSLLQFIDDFREKLDPDNVENDY